MNENTDTFGVFADQQQFLDWLQINHASETEIWLKIFKKASGIPSINWDEAVVAAIAWGWIDGLKRSHDDLAYLQRFTPRTKRSVWSKRNCDHAENLISQGRMQEPGLVAVELARASGKWEAAYAGSADMEIPQDFLDALARNEKAQGFFNTLNRTNLFSIYLRLKTAQKPQTRHARMIRIIEMLSKGEKFH